MAGYSYTWANKKRQVLETYEIIRQEMPLLLGMIGTGEAATSTKVEWMEDSIGPRRFKPTGNSSGSLTVTAEEVAMVKVGSLVMAHGGPELFKVDSASGTTMTVSLVAANGGSRNASNAPANVPWTIVADPEKEGSSAGDGPIHQASMAYNYTQIFRKDVTLSRSAIQTAVYGNLDNQINHQVSLKLEEMVRDMNGVLVFGHRQERSGSALGMAGGLYEFATGEGALSVDGGGTSIFDDIIINDAIQQIAGAGGEGKAVLTCPAQARVFGATSRDQVQILREDRVRGNYVAQVVNALNGSLLTIVADPLMNIVPDQAWVIDPEMIRIRHMQPPTDSDSTENGFDGIRRSLIAETTFEFNNAKLRACQIKGLMGAEEAIAKLRGGKLVQITSSEEAPVFTKAVTE
jgi:hypothetical protein|nr:MAG TPA: Major capsid protein [Caudoviricetes sp.]